MQENLKIIADAAATVLVQIVAVSMWSTEFECHKENLLIILVFSESSIYGPKDWGKVSRHCTGSSQSPINIDTRNISHHRHRSFLRGFYADTRKIGAQLVNNGHAPTFNVDLGTAFLAGGPWGSNRYKLEQFHFHFGCTARTGSEHKVNSFQYSGEVCSNFYSFFF